MQTKYLEYLIHKKNQVRSLYTGVDSQKQLQRQITLESLVYCEVIDTFVRPTLFKEASKMER